MEDKTRIWKITAIAAIALLIVVSVAFIVSMNKPAPQTVQTSPAEQTTLTSSETTAQSETEAETAEEESSDTRRSPEEILAMWTESSQAKQQLSSYIRDVTDESSPDFIPEERRIAVFDLDGTLFSETNPVYFDHCLLVYRVFEDPDYKDKASDYEKYTAAKILQWMQGGDYPENMDIDHGTCIATSFAGMTVDEFQDYVNKFGSQPAPGYEGMTRAESLYKPMLEILDLLDEYGFTAYVVSGTDRLIVRGGLRDTLGLPMNRIIGSDETLVASGQGDTDGLKYQFTKDDRLITGGDFIIKNLKMNKVSVIAQEIGVQPVLSFGNTTGDQSMADYTINNNPYRSMAFMLCCDDTDREYGNIKKADKMYGLCDEHGWIPVSMKNDWTTIYGENVVKNPEVGLDSYTALYEQYKDLLDTTQLPQYEYPGPEAFFTVLYNYIRDDLGSHYAQSDVTIPCPYILDIDESDKDDIRVYGDFRVYNYSLNGITLECESGGSHPGCIHMKYTDTGSGYEITGFDEVADGSGYDETAKEIFGSRYDSFIKMNSDDDAKEKIRAQIIANYVAANDLSVTEYQDYGWDPVQLPAENIDSFYDYLNIDEAA